MDHLVSEADRVARIGAANMRTQRAEKAVGVGLEIAKGVGRLAGEGQGGGGRGEREGRVVVVISGSIEILRKGLAEEERVTVHEAGEFTGRPL